MDGERQIIRSLLLEDHADTAEAMGRGLSKVGHQITIVGTFAAALETLGNLTFDLIICDLQLPDADVCDLFSKIRTLHHGKAIAVSGHGTIKYVERCREAGFDAYLIKPVSISTLQSVVLEVLTDGNLRGADPEQDEGRRLYIWRRS